MFKTILITACFLFSQFLLADEVINLKATFQVPVPSEKFAHLATFEITNFQIMTNNKGVRYMSYTLPDDLTGDAMTIKMPLISEVDGNKHFENEQGIADCSGEWTALECGMHFQNLQINQKTVISHLFLKYGYNQETKNRVIVSSIFSKDPVGLLKAHE